MHKLIKILTEDKLDLDGLFLEGSKEKEAFLYIHGMFGNYNIPNFVNNLEKECSKNNIAYLAINNRGMEEKSKYELLEEAHIDISAGIKFLLDKGYKNVILVGHSAGTVKAIRYLFEGNYKEKIARVVLLAPIDPLGGRIAHGRNNIDEFLIKAQEQIKEGKGNEIVSSDFDHDEVSYQTFVSWYKRDDFGRMFEFCDSNYDFPLLQKINIPVKIIVGTEDEYFYPTNPNNKQEAMNILLNKIKNSEGKFIENSGHNFNGFEKELVGEIMNFV